MRKALPIIILFVMSACGCRRAPSSGEDVSVPFPAVSAPAMLTGRDERLEWMAGHYWDRFLDPSRAGLCDSSHVGGVDPEELERHVGTYVSLLHEVSPSSARSAIEKLCDKLEACEAADTSSNIFERLVPEIARYMYDPDSPLRDEELYLPFASRMASSPHVGGGAVSYAFEAKMCALNRPGEVAADFRFKDIGGRIRTLSSIKAPLTLLFFSNPGCHACAEIMSVLENKAGGLVEDGMLAVVSVYIDDDIDAWKAYAAAYPRSWYSGYDPDGIIRSDLLYHVRAIPSLYLLDEDKRVLLKDAPEERVWAALGL